MLVLMFGLLASLSAETVALTRDGKISVGKLPAPAQAVAVMNLGVVAPSNQDGAVLLRDGSRSIGIPATLDLKQVVVRCDRLGERSFPLDQVAELRLGPGIDLPRPIGFTGAIFVNGDSLAGSIALFRSTNVGLNTGKRVASIPRSRVAAVVLAPVGAGSEGWRVLLDSGDRLIGRMEGGATWKLSGPDLVLPLDRGWSCAWYQGAEVRPLSTLPLKGLSPAIALDRFHDGRPLSARGRPYGHGLAVRGQAVLQVATGGAGRLLGEVAVLEGREVRVRVLVDGREVWTASPHSDEVPTVIDAVLGAGGELSVEISAPAAAGAPLVVLGWPTLVR